MGKKELFNFRKKINFNIKENCELNKFYTKIFVLMREKDIGFMAFTRLEVLRGSRPSERKKDATLLLKSWSGNHLSVKLVFWFYCRMFLRTRDLIGHCFAKEKKLQIVQPQRFFFGNLYTLSHVLYLLCLVYILKYVEFSIHIGIRWSARSSSLFSGYYAWRHRTQTTFYYSHAFHYSFYSLHTSESICIILHYLIH